MSEQSSPNQAISSLLLAEPVREREEKLKIILNFPKLYICSKRYFFIIIYFRNRSQRSPKLTEEHKRKDTDEIKSIILNCFNGHQDYNSKISYRKKQQISSHTHMASYISKRADRSANHYNDNGDAMRVSES